MCDRSGKLFARRGYSSFTQKLLLPQKIYFHNLNAFQQVSCRAEYLNFNIYNRARNLKSYKEFTNVPNIGILWWLSVRQINTLVWSYRSIPFALFWPVILLNPFFLSLCSFSFLRNILISYLKIKAIKKGARALFRRFLKNRKIYNWSA